MSETDTDAMAPLTGRDEFRPAVSKAATPQARNPKHGAGHRKAQMHSIPPIAIILEGEVMRGGGAKYGEFNWAEAGVVASVYYDAMMRHLLAWYTGEDNDPEDNISHLAHVRACCAILLDCQHIGNMEDDRPRYTSKATEVIARIAEARGIMEAQR